MHTLSLNPECLVGVNKFDELSFPFHVFNNGFSFDLFAGQNTGRA